MTVGRQPKAADLDLSQGSIGLQNHNYDQYQLASSIMDVRGGSVNPRRSTSTATGASIPATFPKRIMTTNVKPLIMDGGMRVEHRRSLSQQGRSRIFSSSYLSLEGLFLLVCLTASLLLLPLILPPLPPPPFMLLLLPICILLLLMILAFLPSSSNVRDASYTNL